MKTNSSTKLPVFVLFLALISFTACSEQEGARVESFFFMMFSLTGLTPMILGSSLAVLYNKSIGKGGLLYGFALTFFILNCAVIVFWTIQLTTVWTASKAYQFGEGVVMIPFLYIVAIICLIVNGIGVFAPKPDSLSPTYQHSNNKNTLDSDQVIQKTKMIDEDEEFDLLEDLEDF